MTVTDICDMEEKVIITTFTDPMMGLSYECEPIFRKLETHFGHRVAFRYRMGVLVRDVHDFMIPADEGDTPAQSIQNYNARLAKIYESEESISGMPICMDGFRLFSVEHPSSRPLCLAYHAMLQAAPALADQFLYRLRYATIVETRPTTYWEELLRVARLVGVDEQAFADCYHDGRVEAMLSADLRMMQEMGIHTLPSYLLEYQGRQMLIRRLIGYNAFVAAIARLTDGTVCPQAVSRDRDTLRQLLAKHPLISPIELREAFDFETDEEGRAFVQPLIDSGEIMTQNVKNGYFVVCNL